MAMKKYRYSYESKGVILRDPDTGVVFVPFQENFGGWDCVVLSTDTPNYYRGGHNIWVSDNEVELADKLDYIVPDKQPKPSSNFHAEGNDAKDL